MGEGDGTKNSKDRIAEEKNTAKIAQGSGPTNKQKKIKDGKITKVHGKLREIKQVEDRIVTWGTKQYLAKHGEEGRFRSKKIGPNNKKKRGVGLESWETETQK